MAERERRAGSARACARAHRRERVPDEVRAAGDPEGVARRRGGRRGGRGRRRGCGRRRNTTREPQGASCVVVEQPSGVRGLLHRRSGTRGAEGTFARGVHRDGARGVVLLVPAPAPVHIAGSEPGLAQRRRGRVPSGRGGHEHVRPHLRTHSSAAEQGEEPGDRRRERRSANDDDDEQARFWKGRFHPRGTRSRRDHRRGSPPRRRPIPVHRHVPQRQRAGANVPRGADAGVRQEPRRRVASSRGDGSQASRDAERRGRQAGHGHHLPRAGDGCGGRQGDGDAGAGPAPRAAGIRTDAVARRDRRARRVQRRHRG